MGHDIKDTGAERIGRSPQPETAPQTRGPTSLPPAGRAETFKRSFPPVVDARVRVLVLGSLPGERSLAAARYYAHPQNQFWRLMSAVLDEDFVALDYDARLARLLARHVGLWDVVAHARREGSTDAALRDVRANDLAALVATLPDLCAIGFNGGTARTLGLRQLGAQAARYAIHPLPSSSPMHTIGFAAKLTAWQALAGDCAPVGPATPHARSI